MKGRLLTNAITPEERLEKIHVSLMRDKRTALFSGIMLMGKSEVVDDCPTARTDGLNKFYGREFIEGLTDQELRALVWHENGHVALKHILRFKPLMEKGQGQLVNIACDYVVNDMIVSTDDESFVKLPKGGLYESKYHDWSVNDILKDLQKMQEENPEQLQRQVGEGETLDEHDYENAEGGDTKESVEKLERLIEEGMRQGQILAGKLGGDIPRSITDMLAPKVDWKDVLRDFIQSSMRGKDELTWRKFNKRHLANDIYLPSTEDESVGELVVALDVSGSIGGEVLNSFASELSSICVNTQPDKVRVLWWDTKVSSEQVFTVKDYEHIKTLLKATGGGGTAPECIDKYLIDKNIKAEALIVLTDGAFDKPIWKSSMPSLWVCTWSDKNIPDSAKSVRYQD
jgi:predicted metal-dependent peptidase